MITTTDELQRALVERGLIGIDAEVAPPGSTDANAPAHDRPWYVGLLLGVSGWLAGLFMLGFVALLFRPDTAPAAAVCGAILLGAAWALFKVDRDGAFVAQLALALSIAGQCLLLFAMNEHTHSLGQVAASALLLQTVLALALPNPLQRTLCAFFAAMAWALTVRFALFGEPAFWHGERTVAASSGAALGGWLLAWLPVGVGIVTLIRHEAGWMARGWQPIVRPVLAGLILGLAFATLASQPFESFGGFGAFGDGAVATDWLALWPLLSALGALGGIAAAFALRGRGLIGACGIAALAHVSHFYYALGTGLLFKSLLMLVTGAAMLLAARSLSNEGQP